MVFKVHRAHKVPSFRVHINQDFDNLRVLKEHRVQKVPLFLDKVPERIK